MGFFVNNQPNGTFNQNQQRVSLNDIYYGLVQQGLNPQLRDNSVVFCFNCVGVDRITVLFRVLQNHPSTITCSARMNIAADMNNIESALDEVNAINVKSLFPKLMVMENGELVFGYTFSNANIQAAAESLGAFITDVQNILKYESLQSRVSRGIFIWM